MSKHYYYVYYLFVFIRNESWWSALTFCEEKGGSLPEFHTHHDIKKIMNNRNTPNDAGSYIIYIALYWVRLNILFV